MRSRSAVWITDQAQDVSSSARLVASLKCPHLDADGNPVDRWALDNDPSQAANAVSAQVVSTFDPTVTTLPLETSSVVIQNGVYDYEDSTEYDFAQWVNQSALEAPSRLEVALGFLFGGTSVETDAITTQMFTEAKVATDMLTVTFSGESFTTKLDEKKFYGGRYDAGGISALTLFTEILEDVDFPGEGHWNYLIGDAACVTSATVPLWAPSGFTYYTIDSALADMLVNMPIPVVTHREALTMLAAYTGAYLMHDSNGALHVMAALASQIPYYHFDSARVYERPQITKGSAIGKLTGSLKTYAYAVDSSVITTVDINVETTATATFAITHPACHGGSLALTGAALVGTPVYGTFGTTFVASPAGLAFTAVLNGYAVTIGELAHSKNYGSGATAEFDNPLSSDPTLTDAMFDRYQAMAVATTYEFTMRDDPAVETADCVLLDTADAPTGVPVIVTNIKRNFDGGLTADYTVIENPYKIATSLGLIGMLTLGASSVFAARSPLAASGALAMGGSATFAGVNTFETGFFPLVAYGSVTLSSTLAHSGTYAARIAGTASGEGPKLTKAVTMHSAGVKSFETWFAITGALSSTGATYITGFYPTQTPPAYGYGVVLAYVGTDHKYSMGDNTGGHNVYGTALSLSTWYRSVLEIDATNNLCRATLYNAAGTQLAQRGWTATLAPNTWQGTSQYLLRGPNDGVGTSTITYFDDITDQL